MESVARRWKDFPEIVEPRRRFKELLRSISIQIRSCTRFCLCRSVAKIPHNPFYAKSRIFVTTIRRVRVLLFFDVFEKLASRIRFFNTILTWFRCFCCFENLKGELEVMTRCLHFVCHRNLKKFLWPYGSFFFFTTDWFSLRGTLKPKDDKIKDKNLYIPWVGIQ